jgi:SAM-dependent methyltransferase
MKSTPLKMHWTWKMFVDHGEFFLKVLEKRFQEADVEVEVISKILAEQHVPVGGRILDVYCLIGKHAVALAGRGYDVVGVDISPLMIRRANDLSNARNVQDRAKFVLGDPRHISRIMEGQEKGFHAVLSMYTYVGSYGEKTDRQILKQLRGLVAPGGVLILEASNRDYIVRHLQRASVYDVDGMEYHVRREIDLETSNMENVLRYYMKEGDDLRRKAELKVEHRVYSLHELVSLFNRTGWTFVESFGSAKLEQPTVDSPYLIVVGRAT